MSDCVIGDNEVQLIDGNCETTLNANGTESILATKLNECGTTAFHKGDCIMFSVGDIEKLKAVIFSYFRIK